MLRQSVIAAAIAVATITSVASISSAQAQNGPHQRTNVHHAYTYEPAPSPYYSGPYYYGPYGPYYYGPYGPYYYGAYGPYYYGPSPVVPLANAAGATVCAAFSLIGAC